MNPQLIKNFLKSVQLFDDLEEKELDKIVENLVEENYEKDSLLFTENSPRKRLFVINEGEVELFKKTPSGEEKRLSFFRRYDFLGEGALMDDYPHSVSARALLNTKAYTISREDFRKIIKEDPTMGMKVLSSIAMVISKRIRGASTRVVDAGAQYISGRTRQEHDLLGDREVPFEF